MNLKLKIWRQPNRAAKGKFENYFLEGLDVDMSFLEMLDFLNEKLILEGKSPVVFDHDCREGICGQCGFMIDGIAHGPIQNISTCQLHLRAFKDGQELVLEPFRANAFPVKKDLKVDRSSFDRIIGAGGYVSVNTGQAPEANSIPITHKTAEAAFDAASCIGCGACVATCKNASAALFTAAKIIWTMTTAQISGQSLSSFSRNMNETERIQVIKSPYFNTFYLYNLHKTCQANTQISAHC